MAFTETGKEKEKREAYYKANKERGIRAEQERNYKMFGTTEQNIPNVDQMGNVISGGSIGKPARTARQTAEAYGMDDRTQQKLDSLGMKKGGKVMKSKRYNEGGVTEGRNKNISDDIRERAMRAIAAGGQKEEAVEKKVARKSRMQPESDREEYSPWMRELRKKEATEAENSRESQALFNKKPVDSVSKEDTSKVAKAYQDAAKMSAGMKKGGAVRSSASKRADGIAIRGRTRA